MITPVATTSSTPGSGGGSTSAIDTTGANLLLISVSFYSGSTTVLTVSDSKGNIWIPLTLRNAGNAAHRYYYALDPAVGTSHTVTVSGSAVYPVLTFAAYASADPLAPFEVENGATATSGTSLATGSVTPAVNESLIVSGWAGMNAATNPNVDSGMTKTTSQNSSAGVCISGAAAYLVQTIAAAINPTWTWTGTDHVAESIVVFRPRRSGVWAPTYVQTDTGVVTGPGNPVYIKTFTGNVTAGNILVALCTVAGAAAGSVTDSQGNIWTKQREQGPGATRAVSLWTAFAGSTGACEVTLTVTGGFGAHKVYEFTPDGVTALALDTANGANTSGTATHATGSITPTVDDTWALFGIGVSGGFFVSSGPTGYMARGSGSGEPLLYERKMETPVTHNPALVTTTNETTGVQVVVLKSAAAPVPPNLGLHMGDVAGPIWAE